MSRVRGVAITRPREDALQQAALLESQGIRCFIVPMLEIEPLPEASEQLHAALADHIQAICITSKHALPALVAPTQAKHLPLFVVGEATAAAASALGFENVHISGGTAESLLTDVRAHCRPEQGAILYARGKDITLDLASALCGDGYDVSEVIIYNAHTTTSLPHDYVEALQRGEVDEVHFYSERSAENYVALVTQNNLLSAHHQIRCRAISNKVARPLTAIPFSSTTLTVKGE